MGSEHQILLCVLVDPLRTRHDYCVTSSSTLFHAQLADMTNQNRFVFTCTEIVVRQTIRVNRPDRIKHRDACPVQDGVAGEFDGAWLDGRRVSEGPNIFW